MDIQTIERSTSKATKTDTKMATETKYVFALQEGDGNNIKLLGGKGANWCEMTQNRFECSARICSNY